MSICHTKYRSIVPSIEVRPPSIRVSELHPEPQLYLSHARRVKALGHPSDQPVQVQVLVLILK